MQKLRSIRLQVEKLWPKINLLTNIWSNIYQITPQENMQFCHLNEAKVHRHLNNISDKITPKWQVNFDRLQNNNIDLNIDIDDVKFAIKTMKDKCPGPSKLRKTHFAELPDNVLLNLAHIFKCCLSLGYYPKQFKHAFWIVKILIVHSL